MVYVIRECRFAVTKQVVRKTKSRTGRDELYFCKPLWNTRLTREEQSVQHVSHVGHDRADVYSRELCPRNRIDRYARARRVQAWSVQH